MLECNKLDIVETMMKQSNHANTTKERVSRWAVRKLG